MDLHLLCHNEERHLVIQLSVSTCKHNIVRFKGITPKWAWEEMVRRLHWEYTEDALANATVFESFSNAVDARCHYKIPTWVIARPLSELETKTHFEKHNDLRQLKL